MESNSTFVNSCMALTRGADLGVQIEACIILIMSLISLFITCLLLHILQHSTGQTGADVRSLLLSSLIACIIRSISFILRAIYVLLLVAMGFDNLAISKVACAVSELPYGIATVTTIFSMLAIGINRYHVTMPIDRGSSNSLDRQYKADSNIEGPSSGTRLSIVLIWTVALIFYLVLIIGMTFEDGVVCFCYYPLILRPLFSYLSNACFLALEASVLILYILVFERNRRMLMQFTLRTRQYSLRQRCKAWMNVRTTRMLLPPAIVHVCLVLVIVCGMSPIRDAFTADADVAKLKLILAMHICICLDVLMYPLLCIYFNEHFRVAARDMLAEFISAISPCANVVKTRDQTERAAAPESAKIVVEKGRPRAASNADVQLGSSAGKCTIIDYRLAPEVHEHILQRTWEMKPKIAK